MKYSVIVIMWLIAISMLLGQLMFSFLKFVTEDEENTLKIPDSDKEEMFLILNSFKMMTISQKIMGLLVLGGILISEITSRVINFPFQKKTYKEKKRAK